MKDFRMFRSLVLASVEATASGCLSFGKSPEGITDLCEIAANPASFNGKTVRVAGIAAPEAHYNIFLYSRDCPRTAFIAGAHDAVERTANHEALSKILWVGYPERRKSAAVELVAKFSWRQNEVPTRVMWIKEVASVQENPGQWNPD